jgi:hypothetical protein
MQYIVSFTALVQCNVSGVWGIQVSTTVNSLTTWVYINGHNVPLNANTQVGVFTAKSAGELSSKMQASKQAKCKQASKMQASKMQASKMQASKMLGQCCISCSLCKNLNSRLNPKPFRFGII